MTMLITLAQAKSHVRQTVHTGDDQDLTEFVEAASEQIVKHLDDSSEYGPDYLSAFLDSEGDVIDPDLVPRLVQQACKMLVAIYFANRGEDGGASAAIERGYLPPAVVSLLQYDRDPGFA